MAERPVTFVIDVKGGDEAQREFVDLKTREQEAATTTAELTAALKQFQKAGGDSAKTIKAFRREIILSREAQKKFAQEAKTSSSSMELQAIAAQAARQKVEQLGSVLGQVGTVLGRVNPEMAGFGSLIGTISATLPALTGSLGPLAFAMAAITIAAEAMNLAMAESEARINDVSMAAATARDRISALAGEIQAAAGLDVLAGGGGTAAATQSALDRNRAEIDAAAEVSRRAALEARFLAADIRNATGERVQELAQASRDAATTARTAADETVRLIELRERLNQGLVVSTAREAAVEAEREAARSARERETLSSAGARTAEARQREAIRVQAIEQRDIELEMNEILERRAQAQAQAQADLQSEIAVTAAAQVEQLANEQAAARVREQIRTRELELSIANLERMREAQREATEAVRADAEATLGPIVSMTTDALVSIIAGAESADQAFQGLLSSFLEMIAQQAALEAAKEFASAIASFASLDVGGGALHLAAGAAWVGVAVAAGAGSVAAAPAQAAPVSPESAADTGGAGGGGTNVFNINGTIISADGPGARARAGREIGALFSEGQRRFGRTG